MAVIESPAVVAERRASGMGTYAHVIVVGGTTEVFEASRDALRRIGELERLWSRFRSESELSRLNADSGEWLSVSPETVRLVTELVAAWQHSGGRFDPSVGAAVIAAGYDRPFSELPSTIGVWRTEPTPNADLAEVEVDPGGCVRLPAGLGLDAGGLGKGLAADIVVAELLARPGVDGALVSIGGDLRCDGAGPHGSGWAIEVGDPVAGVPDEVLVLDRGGVATSTPARRRWLTDSGWAHHLIDPRNRRPTEKPPAAVTVVAGRATDAEWIATAIAAGAPGLLFRLDGDFTVIATDAAGRRLERGPIREFQR